MKRSSILFGVLALVLIAAFSVYAMENSTWGKVKKASVQGDLPLAKAVGGKKLTTQFYELDGTLTTATYRATGDGGWQEWQTKEDGTRTHIIFKPYERMMPEEGGWWLWTSHEYDQPEGVPDLPEELTDGTQWWVLIIEL